jgi:hypothetical protein
VKSGEGGYVFPSKVTGTETGATGTDEVIEYFTFTFSFEIEIDRIGTCSATNTCNHAETSISGTGGEYDPPEDGVAGACERSSPVSQGAATLTGFQASIEPDASGAEHRSYDAQSFPIDTNILGSNTSLTRGFNHVAGDSTTSPGIQPRRRGFPGGQ